MNSDKPSRSDLARRDRLKAALRENLKRRKVQARARLQPEPGSEEAAAADPGREPETDGGGS